MVYYTNYSDYVSYNTSVAVTMSAWCNKLADMLAANFGFTVVTRATEGVASSSTNFAEVSWHSVCNLRFYYYSTTYYLAVASLYSGGSVLQISTWGKPYSADGKYYINLRSYNTKKGLFFQIQDTTSAYLKLLLGLELTRISDGATYYGLVGGAEADGATRSALVNDGLNSDYGVGGYCKTYDNDATKVVLIPLLISLGSGAFASGDPIRFMASNCYLSSSYIMTGLVSVNSRNFYIFQGGASGTYIAVELN